MESANIAVQVIFALAIFVVTVVIGLAPSRSETFNKPRLATLGNCFSAGILLSIALIQLIPEGVIDVDRTVDSTFALGNVLTVVGFLLILILEKVVFFDQVHGPVRKDLAQFRHAIPVQEDESLDEDVPRKEQPTQPLASTSERAGDMRKKKILRGLYLSIALSIHGFLEGVAIGLQRTLYGTSGLALAVFIHKFPAALALGINTRVMHKLESTVLISSFSVASPLGVCVGIGLQSLGDPLLAGVFMALCAGSFLYISTTELIAEEFASPRDKWLKMGCFLSGFALFIGISQAVQAGR